MNVVDDRPESEKVPNVVGELYSYTKTLGDGSFAPSPIEMLDNRISQEFGGGFEKESLVVHSFLITNYFPESGSRSTLIHRVNAQDSVSCAIDATYRGVEFSIRDSQPYTIGLVWWSAFEAEEFREPLRKTIDGCINQTIEKIEEIRGKSIAYVKGLSGFCREPLLKLGGIGGELCLHGG